MQVAALSYKDLRDGAQESHMPRHFSPVCPWLQQAMRRVVGLPGRPATLLWLCLGVAACSEGPQRQGRQDVPVAESDPVQGQRLLTQYQCGSCHAIPGVAAARGGQGPSLEAFGRRSYIAGRIPNNPDSLARWIVAPSALVPDTAMPSMGVSPAEARDMAAYLGTLQ